MKKPSRGRKAEAGPSKANLSGVDEIQPQPQDHQLEDTWSVAEFRVRISLVFRSVTFDRLSVVISFCNISTAN